MGCNVQKTSTYTLALHWASSEKRKQYIISISSHCWIYIVLELIPFMPQCPKHLTETAEEKKGFIWPQFQRITLCHNRRGVGRKTLSVREDGEHGGRELGDSKGQEYQSTDSCDLLPPPRPSLLKAQQHPKK